MRARRAGHPRMPRVAAMRAGAHAVQMPATPTFWNRRGLATADGGQADSLTANPGCVKAARNAAIDSRIAQYGRLHYMGEHVGASSIRRYRRRARRGPNPTQAGRPSEGPLCIATGRSAQASSKSRPACESNGSSSRNETKEGRRMTRGRGYGGGVDVPVHDRMAHLPRSSDKPFPINGLVSLMDGCPHACQHNLWKSRAWHVARRTWRGVRPAAESAP
ncbi:Uncharacterised protein [Burkholderia cepacia]|nr:hypothetical protein DM41_3662 [Burkholderia cepacia ATCC 25416]SPU75271.1 Uncharacterised protein [Burkholderia cepacia]